MDLTVWLISIDVASCGKEREEQLIAAENAMFEAARARAGTVDERRFWDEFITLRSENLQKLFGTLASRR